MLPRTSCPFRPLSQVGALPLWQAGRLIRRMAGEALPVPAAPGELLLGENGEVCLRAGEAGTQSGTAEYDPPELRLHRRSVQPGPAETYRLCALFVHLLAGAPLSRMQLEETRERRRSLRRVAAEVCSSPEAEELLFGFLERGLRLEPGRRFPDREECLAALDEIAAVLNEKTAKTTVLQGTAGFFSGTCLPLALSAVAGRQTGECRILFPPGTPGVSRRHCRIALCWGAVTVTDLHSRYGTFLENVRLQPGAPVLWNVGETLWLGSRKEALCLTAAV